MTHEQQLRDAHIEGAINQILENIGEDKKREGLLKTPQRISKMCREIFRGYDETQKPKVTTFSNDDGENKIDQMIFDRGSFFSMCEHHMLPFWGSYTFAYIPHKKILGISKVGRTVDYFAAKLQIQERLTQEIADDLWQTLEPLGIGLELEARHLCKEMRGAKKENAPMTTSYVFGKMRDDAGIKNEFLSKVNRGRTR